MQKGLQLNFGAAVLKGVTIGNGSCVGEKACCKERSPDCPAASDPAKAIKPISLGSDVGIRKIYMELFIADISRDYRTIDCKPYATDR